MTKEQRMKAINLAFEAMLYAQMLADAAATPRERGIAEAIYAAHNALYLVLCGDRLAEKTTGGPVCGSRE